MIITRTPFRVSFAGGGTDVKWFYQKNGYGCVLSTAIKKYMYIVIHPYFHKNFHHNRIRLKYAQTEDIATIDEIKHPIIRECLRRLDLPGGIEIASFADVPSGTGLGSSSSFTVGLLHALYAWKGKMVSKKQLANEACEIEIDILKQPIGKQDQYAAAYGGINIIKFNDDESVSVSPLTLQKSVKKNLESNFCLYYMGNRRTSKDILSRQNSPVNIIQKYTLLCKLMEQVEDIKCCLTENSINKIGQILDQGWNLKKKLDTKISNNSIDTIYNKAKTLGASGGKLLGAGGTGFLLIESNNHHKLIKNLGVMNIPFEIDKEGSKVIFYE